MQRRNNASGGGSASAVPLHHPAPQVSCLVSMTWLFDRTRVARVHRSEAYSEADTNAIMLS